MQNSANDLSQQGGDDFKQNLLQNQYRALKSVSTSKSRFSTDQNSFANCFVSGDKTFYTDMNRTGSSFMVNKLRQARQKKQSLYTGKQSSQLDLIS